mgnify:FL=1
MQGKQNIYETDEVFPVIEAAQKLSGRTYGDDEAWMCVSASWLTMCVPH